MRKIITDDLLKKIVAIQLILVLTMVDFLMISINVISYAVGIVSTNEPNVEFKAYFLNESNEEVSEYNLPLKSEDVKLHLQITVKNSGYFNGQISLENANFDLIKDILPEGVSKIVDNTIFLSQISAEKTLDIQVGIRAKLDKNPTNLTDTVNLKLSGTYRNGESGEDKSVEAKTNLKVNIVSSYTSEDNPAILTQELLTNRVYTVNGENKRIVQTLIKSKIENNAYPISWTGLILSLPENAEVSIAKIKTNATNPDVILKEGENVWLADGCLNVLLENVEKQDGSIYWDNGEDSLVATYVLSENETLQETSIGSAIMLCDESLFITELNTLQITEEKDGIISLDIEEKKESIYKGKIYTGEEREYTENVSVSVNYLGIANKVNVSLDQSNYLKGEETKEANIEYRSIKINKQKFQEIFGEEGKIVTSINNITITKDSEVDEEGNVVITVPEGVNKIEIETSEPKTLGVLDIEVTKVIKENKYQKDEIEKLNYIQNNVSGKYVVLGEDDHNIAKKWSNIELKDTVTSASFEMGTTTLSSSKKNEVEMKIVLDTKGEDKKLYKNPTFSIEFPEEVHNVEIKSANGAFLASTLTKKDENVEDKDGKKVINVTFVGEQTKYSENSVEGEASIIITADVELDAKSTNKTGTVTLKYTNANDEEGKVNTLSKEIKIDALKQVILVNAISEYGVETLGEEESKQIKLEKQIIAKEVYNTMQIINNEENAIGNVKILGSFPTKNENTNTIEAKITEAISVQGIKEGDYSIYYTENENATDDKDNIDFDCTIWDINDRYTVFTLEEFLEKYPFKIGDFVRIPEYESEVRICKMKWCKLSEHIEYLVYRNDDEEWYTAEELLDYNDNPNEIPKNKEEKKINQMSLANCDLDEVEIVLGDKFELKIEDGKYYAVRKKLTYPKTYNECYSILNDFNFPNPEKYDFEFDWRCKINDKDYGKLMQSFIKLFICRNAYWKIAGEQMGLGKPWEPKSTEMSHAIVCRDDGDFLLHRRTRAILIFPTEEMRDAFYENFKKEIEQCKELL